jgi:hypothetical protein
MKLLLFAKTSSVNGRVAVERPGDQLEELLLRALAAPVEGHVGVPVVYRMETLIYAQFVYIKSKKKQFCFWVKLKFFHYIKNFCLCEKKLFRKVKFFRE